MGVISIGASLGVREVRATAPAVPAPASASSTRRSSVSVSASGASNNRKKSARKRLASGASGAKKRSASANNAARNERVVAAVARCSSSPSAINAAAPKSASVTPTVVNGKKPIGRMVHVKTTMDPERLAPHVIGVKGGKLNAIMSRARCSISLRKPESEETSGAFSMAFMISANTEKRVDEGVQLLQAVVESAEQQLRKYGGSGRSMEQVHEMEEQGTVEVQMEELIGTPSNENTQQYEEKEAAQAEERHAQMRIQREEKDATVQTSVNSAGTSRSPPRKEQWHPKRRREGGSASSTVSKRGRSDDSRTVNDHQPQRSPQRTSHTEESKDDRGTTAIETVARAEEEQRLRDEREAFRIRLARTVMISRHLEAEAKRAHAQEILERDKYLRLRRQYEEMKHRKKVAEFVVKKQCSAMTASLSTSSPSKKRQRLLEIERLSTAHEACPSATSRLLAPDLRLNIAKANRVKKVRKTRAGFQLIDSVLMGDEDLMRLVKKVQAFGEVITSGSTEPPPVEDPIVLDQDEDTTDVFDFSNENADFSMDASNAGEPKTVEPGDSEDKNTPRNESFRSTWDLPGLARDLNLIQDYSSETDCKLLRFLAGERQYFYLEPLDDAISHSHDVKRWLLTAHDLQILHRYLIDRAEFGKELVLCAERLRALGNLVPPLPTSSEKVIGELGLFESSRHTEWSELQDKIVALHSLALAAHLVGKHYLARHVIGSNREALHACANHEHLLSEGTLESDLFTYILRPIRSSAIESSLFDSLPISLVRETIEQCPEVVNHVLQWKGKEDVPDFLVEVGPSERPTSPSCSFFLRNLLARLTTYLRGLDGVMKEIVATLTEKRPDPHVDNANHVSLRRQRIVQQVNRLKAVTTQVIVENTKLQLHKWWVLFADNSCAWFDPDDPDDVDEADDRSYDKFTCLQDALYIWHNEALLYTTKDDFVDPERLEDSSFDAENAADDEYGTRAHTSGSPFKTTARETKTPMPQEEEMAALLRLTPASMRDEVQNQPFTRDEAKKSIMTPLKVEKARTQLEESLGITRDLMSKLGHAGPWRSHVKHSNNLKRELAKQVAIQKRLVRHQWARYYSKYQEFAPQVQTQLQAEASLNQEGEEKYPAETQQSEHTLESGDDSTSMVIDWTGVFDPKDAPDVVEMKKLRHELTLAKDQLLRDISGNDGSEAALNTDQKALMDECEGLAASCLQALGKFLGAEETGATVTRVQKVPSKQTRSATKARSDKRAKSDKPKTSDRRHAKKASAHPRSSPGSRRRNESIRVAKALAASNVGLLIPTTRSSNSRAMSVRGSKATTRSQRSDGNSPLRMGCSGCRDLRRRCTGCSGCCLHCVCVSCGCRMCCSSRLAAVQKTMTHMLDIIESNEACKWTSSASAGNEGRHCGMLFFCQHCHCCEDHCPCLLTRSATSSSAPMAASTDSSGFIASLHAAQRPSAAAPSSRRERRFKINPVAAQRRGVNLPTNGIFDGDETGASAHEGDNATHSRSGRGPLPTFDYGIEGAFGLDQRGQCRTWRPAPSDKNEQEDLFRAARVRMKLVRSAFAKSTGQSSSSGCLDGEQLWQPERIRMMWERRDFYGVLGLQRDATVQQIKRQYRKLALKLHPDKASDKSASLESTVAQAGKNVGAGMRVDAFVAATHSYKILLGDNEAMHRLG